MPRRKRSADYLLAADEVDPKVASASVGASRQNRDKYFQERKLIPAVVRRWQEFLAKDAKAAAPSSVWALWHAFAKLPDDKFEAEAAKLKVGQASSLTSGSKARLGRKLGS